MKIFAWYLRISHWGRAVYLRRAIRKIWWHWGRSSCDIWRLWQGFVDCMTRSDTSLTTASTSSSVGVIPIVSKAPGPWSGRSTCSAELHYLSMKLSLVLEFIGSWKHMKLYLCRSPLAAQLDGLSMRFPQTRLHLSGMCTSSFAYWRLGEDLRTVWTNFPWWLALYTNKL